jgi:hypothetical protein
MTHGDLSRAVRAAAAHVFDASRVALFTDAAVGALDGWRKRDAAAVALLKALTKRVRRESARLLGVTDTERALLNAAYGLAVCFVMFFF